MHYKLSRPIRDVALVLLCIAGGAFATPSTVTCSIAGTTPVPSAGSCLANAGTAIASANGSYSLSVATDASQYSELNSSASLAANGQDNGVAGFISADSTVSASYSTRLKTAGADRWGLIQVIFTGTSKASPDGSMGGASVQMPTVIDPNGFLYPLSGTCSTGGSSECFSSQSALSRFGGVQPFELGTEFTLAYIADVSAFSENREANAFATVNIDYKFRFFEADGVTPVAVEAVLTPEPSTAGLFAIPFGLLIPLALRRRPPCP